MKSKYSTSEFQVIKPMSYNQYKNAVSKQEDKLQETYRAHNINPTQITLMKWVLATQHGEELQEIYDLNEDMWNEKLAKQNNK